MKKKELIEKITKEVSAEAVEIAQAIFTLAEPAFKEEQSVKLLAQFLERHGFEVSYPWRNLPTAFQAVAGSGKSAVGILGEYDALPDCGLTPGTWGHGCGHNLLGVGSAVGAVAAALALKSEKRAGRVIYYGCPAEETLAGKVYMARDGAFRDLDACLGWHPSSITGGDYYGGSAMDSIIYEFYGKTGHAASPVGSKSALDAAILFDIAVNYLRETVPENMRIHSVILNGGDAPNVVPAYARSWYFIRGLDRKQVEETKRLMHDCARGAAIATQTRHVETLVTALYNKLPNQPIYDLLNGNLQLFGGPKADASDRKRVKELGLSGALEGAVHADGTSKGPTRASSDETNVSWIAPFGRFLMSTHARGTSAHHRLWTAQMNLPYAMRGMLQAGKVLAGSTFDLLTTPKLIQQVRKDFRQRTKGLVYDPIIPKRQQVPMDMASFRAPAPE